MTVDEALVVANGDTDTDPRAAALVLADEVRRLRKVMAATTHLTHLAHLAQMAATIAAGTEAGLEPSDSWGSAEDVARRAVCVAREILAELERENVGPR